MIIFHFNNKKSKKLKGILVSFFEICFKIFKNKNFKLVFIICNILLRLIKLKIIINKSNLLLLI